MAGPPGVGKTRLALACLDQAERAGFAIARATATRAAKGLPFGALAPLLPPVHHDQGEHLDDRAALLRQSAAALVEQASGRELILFVDDAHLLDDTSAVLIHQLAANNAARILTTLRTEEPAPDPIVGLWKDGILERLTLGSLSTEAIDEALCSALGGPVDRAAVDLLALRCQGNMLFLRELVQGAHEDGSLRNDGGIWRLVGPLSPSARLTELVQVRLGNLEEAERTVLELMSFGEPLGPAELNALADPRVIDRLERRGLLSTRRDGRRLEIRLANPISGDVLRARIPGLQAAAIARSLGEVVEATGARRREDTLRVATWRLDGGGAEPHLMLAGAIMARRYCDFLLAERMARAALDAEDSFDAGLLVAQLANLQGREDEAEAELAALATRAADDRQRGLVALTRIDNYVFRGVRLDDALQVADDAEATIQDPIWLSEIAARRSLVWLSTIGPSVALEAVEPFLHRTGSPATVYACWVASHALIRLGRLGDAVEAAARGQAAEGTLPWPTAWLSGPHVNLHCDALMLEGRISDAEALADQHYEQSLADRSAERQALLALAMCKTTLARGRVRTAGRYGREAVALCKQLGRPYFESYCLPYLTLALALSALTEELAALPVIEDLELQPARLTGTDPLQARAWVAVANGDLRRARTLLEEAATLGESVGDRVGAATALHDSARLGRARAVLPRLTRIAEEVEGDFTRARLEHTRALAHHDAPGLEQMSATFETMGADLLAAEATAAATVIWRQKGEKRYGAAAAHRAGALAERCEGATTPALQAIDDRARLGPAERHAAVLAANGRSNKEIAKELQLSIRTVETYLHRAYEKLGVSGRDELAAALKPPHQPGA